MKKIIQVVTIVAFSLFFVFNFAHAETCSLENIAEIRDLAEDLGLDATVLLESMGCEVQNAKIEWEEKKEDYLLEDEGSYILESKLTIEATRDIEIDHINLGFEIRSEETDRLSYTPFSVDPGNIIDEVVVKKDGEEVFRSKIKSPMPAQIIEELSLEEGESVDYDIKVKTSNLNSTHHGLKIVKEGDLMFNSEGNYLRQQINQDPSYNFRYAYPEIVSAKERDNHFEFDLKANHGDIYIRTDQFTDMFPGIVLKDSRFHDVNFKYEYFSDAKEVVKTPSEKKNNRGGKQGSKDYLPIKYYKVSEGETATFSVDITSETFMNRGYSFDTYIDSILWGLEDTSTNEIKDAWIMNVGKPGRLRLQTTIGDRDSIEKREQNYKLGGFLITPINEDISGEGISVFFRFNEEAENKTISELLESLSIYEGGNLLTEVKINRGNIKKEDGKEILDIPEFSFDSERGERKRYEIRVDAENYGEKYSGNIKAGVLKESINTVDSIGFEDKAPNTNRFFYERVLEEGEEVSEEELGEEKNKDTNNSKGKQK